MKLPSLIVVLFSVWVWPALSLQLTEVKPTWIPVAADSAVSFTFLGAGFGDGSTSFTVSLSNLDTLGTLIVDSVAVNVVSDVEAGAQVTIPADLTTGEYILTIGSDTDNVRTTVTAYDSPQVSGANPSRIPLNGGAQMVISGTGFAPSSSIQVRFFHASSGHQEFAPGVLANGAITCTAPQFYPPGVTLVEGDELITEIAVALDGQNFVAAGSDGNVVFYDKGVLKIGFIMVGPINDFGWTFAQNFGRMTLETVYGSQIETHYAESVPEGEENYEIVQDVVDHLVGPAEEGGLECDLVFAGSFGFLVQTREAARRHPDKFFVHLAGYANFDDPPNIAYAWSMIYEMRYLSGLVAGLHVQKCVGYIAAYDSVPEVRRGVNAFAKGCRETNPNCEVKVLWTQTWHDPWIEEHAAKVMWEEHGCDMIAQHSDTEEPQNVFAENGGVGIGYNSDMRVLVGDSVLTGPMLVWFPIFQRYVDAVLTDSWVSEEYFGYSADGGMTLAPYSPVVEYSTRALIRTKWDALIEANGKETVFCGDLITNTGAPPPADQIGEDGCLTFGAIVGMDPATTWSRPLMDWHWEGVEDLGYYTAPPDESHFCGEIHWTYSVADCSADTESRVVTFSWLEPRNCEGGLDLPTPVELDCDMIPSDSGTGTLVTVLAIIGTVVSLGFGVFVFLFREKPVIRVAQKPFCYMFCVGSASACLAVLGFLGKNTDGSCMMRPWLLHLSVTFMFGGLFVKVWRVNKIFNNVGMKKRKISNSKLYGLMAKLVAVDVLLLLLWTLTTPSEAIESVDNEAGVGEVHRVECESEEGLIRTLMALWKVGLIMYGVYLAFVTRNVNSAFSEAQYILLAIYNVAFVGGLTLMLKENLGVSAKSGLLLQAAGTVWCTSASLACVFVPKMFSLNASSQDIMSTSASQGTGTGTATAGEIIKVGPNQAAEVEKLQKELAAAKDEIAKLKEAS